MQNKKGAIIEDNKKIYELEKDMREKAEKEICKLKQEIKELKEQLENPAQFLPIEPIKCADFLIDASFTYKKSELSIVVDKAFCGNDSEYATDTVYSVDDLRQIAEHLLVYCNHAEKNNEE